MLPQERRVLQEPCPPNPTLPASWVSTPTPVELALPSPPKKLGFREFGQFLSSSGVSHTRFQVRRSGGVSHLLDFSLFLQVWLFSNAVSIARLLLPSAASHSRLNPCLCPSGREWLKRLSQGNAQRRKNSVREQRFSLEKPVTNQTGHLQQKSENSGRNWGVWREKRCQGSRVPGLPVELRFGVE